MHQLLHGFSHAGTKGGSLPLSRLVPYMNIQIGSRWFLWSGLGSPSTCLPDFKPILRHTWLSSSWEPWWSSYALATHDNLSTTRSSLRMLGELESAKWAFRWRKFAQLMSYSHECVNWLTSLFAFVFSLSLFEIHLVHVISSPLRCSGHRLRRSLVRNATLILKGV